MTEIELPDRLAPEDKVSKDHFASAEPELRLGLVNAQYDLMSAGYSVVLLIAGDDRIGVNSVVKRLHEWMDGRYLAIDIFSRPTHEEAQRPRFWRYWRSLPPDGHVGVYVGGWALHAVGDRVNRRAGEGGFMRRLARIRTFEEALAADGTQLLKFWVHLPRKALEKRLKRAAKDRDVSWLVEDSDWGMLDVHDVAVTHIQKMLNETNTGPCPWQVIEGSHRRTRDLTFGKRLLEQLHSRLAGPPAPDPSDLQTGRPGTAMPERPAPEGPVSEAPASLATVLTGPEFPDALGALDLDRRLEKPDYAAKLNKYQARVGAFTRRSRDTGLSSVLVFEGWDAAGKGGVIRRLTAMASVRDYTVVPVAAPGEEERQRHYLWRFWRRLQPAGRMLIFDRSWYGRVLVERVESLAEPYEWQRAYDEINDFEAQLTEHGIVVCKFWLHIDPDEQLRRFEARQRTPYKKYKITEEDYRNRDRWDDYLGAVNEMVARTSTELAPWHLVPANDKWVARVEVLKQVSRAYAAGFERVG